MTEPRMTNNQDSWMSHAFKLEAEIERLTAEVVEDHALLVACADKIERLTAEADAGHREISRLNTHINKLDAEIERLRASFKRLVDFGDFDEARKALKPTPKL